MTKFVYLKTEFTFKEVILSKNLVGIVKDYSGDFVIVEFTVIEKPIKLPKELLQSFDPLKTGDGFPKKVCNVCFRLLDTSFFDKNQNGINNRTVRRPSCKDCREKIDGTNMSIKEKKEWEKTKPHFVIFKCPVCFKKTIPGLTSKVVLDHNHITGRARAWICDSCNTGLGRFKDDTRLLKNAIDYLGHYKNSGNETE